MNKQLTLLDDKKQTSRRTHARRVPSTGQSMQADSQWWRLSEQEREIGLNGIRHIRSILEQIPDPDQKAWAQAS